VRGNVSADVGYGDPAFVFDPATARDGALAADMRTLLGTAPPQARECLSAQIGQVATRNSCRGPWTASLDLWLIKSSWFVIGAQRAHAQVFLKNALGAIDYLMHGKDGRHGWGDEQWSDATLLTVRGFDPGARRYAYSVNPRFGATDGMGVMFRNPFSLTFKVILDFSTSIQKQSLRNRSANAGVPVGDTTVLYSLARMTAISAYRQALNLAEAMRLTPAQVQTLDSLDLAYESTLRARQREHVLRLSPVIAAANDQELMKLLGEARKVEQPMKVEAARRLRAMLTQLQWDALDHHVRNDLDGHVDDP
jgi:hypothetical protein